MKKGMAVESWTSHPLNAKKNDYHPNCRDAQKTQRGEEEKKGGK